MLDKLSTSRDAAPGRVEVRGVPCAAHHCHPERTIVILGAAKDLLLSPLAEASDSGRRITPRVQSTTSRSFAARSGRQRSGPTGPSAHEWPSSARPDLAAPTTPAPWYAMLGRNSAGPLNHSRPPRMISLRALLGLTLPALTIASGITPPARTPSATSGAALDSTLLSR